MCTWVVVRGPGRKSTPELWEHEHGDGTGGEEKPIGTAQYGVVSSRHACLITTAMDDGGRGGREMSIPGTPFVVV